MIKLYKLIRAKKLKEIIEPSILSLLSGARLANARADELTQESYEYKHAVAYGTLKKQVPSASDINIEMALVLAKKYPELNGK